jgi:hypothetical protein
MRATDFVALNTIEFGAPDTMLQQGLVHGQFSFSYTGDDGEFYLDGWNQDISDGNFTWLDLDLAKDEAPGLWKIKADAVKLDGSNVLPEQRMIVDTGKFWTSIPKSPIKEVSFDCTCTCYRNKLYAWPDECCRSVLPVR